MVQDKHRNFYFCNLYGQPPQPVEFGPDQIMVVDYLNEQIIKRDNILIMVPDRHTVTIDFRQEVITGLSFGTLTFKLR